MEISDSFNIPAPSFCNNPVTFFKEVRAELLKVSWPKRAEVIKLTGVVIGFSVAVGAYLGGLDFILTKITEILLSK